MDKERYIIHADMDAFFAAVEERDNPELKGRPVVVGADPKGGLGRGVVSTCSYRARRYGIHSAMPVSVAFAKCPQAVFLPVNMEKYQVVSEQVYSIFYDFTPCIEPVSIDEAFLDITDSFHLFGSPQNVAELIKSRIVKDLRLTVSVGLSPNKFVSKIASDICKPDGFICVRRGDVKDFLSPLDVGKIPGVGKKTGEQLNKMGISKIGDINRFSKWQWVKMLGQEGLCLWKQANGIDKSKVSTGDVEKSLSKEKTFYNDTNDDEKINSTLMHLCEVVSYRLRIYNRKTNKVTLKIRLADFTTYTREVTLCRSTNFVDVLYKKVNKLYLNFRKDPRQKIRLLGVKVSKFVPADSRDFIFEDAREKKLENIHKVTNRIQAKFGTDSIYRASSMNS